MFEKGKTFYLSLTYFVKRIFKPRLKPAPGLKFNRMQAILFCFSYYSDLETLNLFSVISNETKQLYLREEGPEASLWLRVCAHTDK